MFLSTFLVSMGPQSVVLSTLLVSRGPKAQYCQRFFASPAPSVSWRRIQIQQSVTTSGEGVGPWVSGDVESCVCEWGT